MKDIILKLLVRIAHLSGKLTATAEELDKIYEIIGDQAFIDMIKQMEQK